MPVSLSQISGETSHGGIVVPPSLLAVVWARLSGLSKAEEPLGGEAGVVCTALGVRA